MVIKHSRAQRKHDRCRLKKKRIHYWGYGKGYWRAKDMPPSVMGRIVTTPCVCSCYMCGNSRKHEKRKEMKLTMQERRALEAWDDEIEDI